MNDCSILILSCDNYEDIWQPFFILYNKYFKTDMKTYITTETKQCPYATTINKNYPIEQRTARIRETLKEIPTKYVIVMDEDNFISEQINIKEIENCISYMNANPNIAQFNFEPSFDKNDKECQYKGWLQRNNKAPYLNSFQPSIHNREILIDRLSQNMDGWKWETQLVDTKYEVYISKKENRVIKYGKELDPIYGIFRGKWYKPHVVPLFAKENIKVNFMKRGFYGMPKLSIIIPYYKTLAETKILLDNLIKQKTDDVEIIVIDDGCNEKQLDKYNQIKVIHQSNKGVSNARNKGIEVATGEYITFIDSDDNVADNYIAKILDKISTTEFDYCLFSWKATGRLEGNYIIKNNAPKWNTSVWNCIYKKDSIKNIRFNENKHIGEDEEFNLQARKGKKANIEDILYIYNSSRIGSLTSQYRGLKSQIVIYMTNLNIIGGIETFIQELIKELVKKHEVLFLYKNMNIEQLRILKQYIKCIEYTGQNINCDVFINNRITDKIPDRINAKRYIQMIHADIKALKVYALNLDKKITDYISVSEVAQKSFKEVTGQDSKVIYNLLNIDKPQKVLNLVTCSRLTWEKGKDKLYRIANRLNELHKPFLWNVFTDLQENANIDGFIFRKPIQKDIDYIANADFYITGSETESWGYSTAKAFELGIPTISFGYPAIYEQGLVEGQNGYILKDDMSNLDEIIDKMYSTNLKGFKYEKKDNISEWEEVLNLPKKKNDYKLEQYKAKSLVDNMWFKNEDVHAKIGTEFIINDKTRLEYLLSKKAVEEVK